MMMFYRVLLGGWILLVVMVTTYPWTKLVATVQWHRINWIPFHGVPILPGDIALNTLLFAPLGFLLVVASRHPRDSTKALIAILLSFGLSVSVESIQGFSLTRFPSMTDVIFNVVGGGLGSLAGIWWMRGARQTDIHVASLPHVSSSRSSKRVD